MVIETYLMDNKLCEKAQTTCNQLVQSLFCAQRFVKRRIGSPDLGSKHCSEDCTLFRHYQRAASHSQNGQIKEGREGYLKRALINL